MGFFLLLNNDAVLYILLFYYVLVALISSRTLRVLTPKIHKVGLAKWALYCQGTAVTLSRGRGVTLLCPRPWRPSCRSAERHWPQELRRKLRIRRLQARASDLVCAQQIISPVSCSRTKSHVRVGTLNGRVAGGIAVLGPRPSLRPITLYVPQGFLSQSRNQS